MSDICTKNIHALGSKVEDDRGHMHHGHICMGDSAERRKVAKDKVKEARRAAD